MGDFAMTCSISGLGIGGDTAVRCLLLTASPYGGDGRRGGGWIVRTPPLRAHYNSYGSIERIHPDDKFITELWLRGFREDLIEIGLGDNSCHDLPVRAGLSLEDLLDAIQAGRVKVKQDAEYFWHRPMDHTRGYTDEMKARIALVPDMTSVEQVLREDALLVAAYPDPVSNGKTKGKFVVDAPVPHLVRVRFGQYEHGAVHMAALEGARDAVVRAGFVGAITAGSGRYADDADLLVFPQPNPTEYVHGPQWDMAPGKSANGDKHLQIRMAMVREDVWQELLKYPHDDYVSKDCNNLGLFPEDVQHVVVPSGDGARAWYGIEAFRWGTRETWHDVRRYFDGTAPEHEPNEELDAAVAKMMKDLEVRMQADRDRVAALPPEERAQLEIQRQTRRELREAEERARQEHPHFGDFKISDSQVRNLERPGSWIFRDSVPGVIGIADHLSMCLADKKDVPDSVLDAMAELSAVTSIIRGVGITWKPAVSSGPQHPEWSLSERFTRSVLRVANHQIAKDLADGREDYGLCYDTLAAVVEKARTPGLVRRLLQWLQIIR